MRPTATIQVTTIEFVIGKPNGLAISTAFCERPGSSCSGTIALGPADPAATADIAELFVSFTSKANAHVAARHRTTDAKKSALSGLRPRCRNLVSIRPFPESAQSLAF